MFSKNLVQPLQNFLLEEISKVEEATAAVVVVCNKSSLGICTQPETLFIKTGNRGGRFPGLIASLEMRSTLF